MRRGLVLRGEDAGAFERDVDAERPCHGSCAGSLIAVTLIGAVAATDGVALDRHLAGKAAVHAVVAQQMRVGLDRREIVDGDDFDVVAAGFDDGAQDIAADAAKPVDGNA